MKLTLYILSLLTALLVTSCHTKDGAPGPAGTSYYKQQGTINGTLTYVDQNDKPVSHTFDYQFYATDLTQNEFNYDSSKKGYVVSIFRREEKESGNSFAIYLQGEIDTAYIQPTHLIVDFGFLKKTSQGLFVFQDMGRGDGSTYSSVDVYTPPSDNDESVFTISHYSFNALTGQLSFNYEITYSPDDVEGAYLVDGNVSAIVKGSVNVILKRNPYNTDIPNFQDNAPSLF